MVQVTEMIPEWERMRDRLREQVELFGPEGKGINPAYPVDMLRKCIGELDSLISYYSSSKR